MFLAAILILLQCPTTEPFACTALWNKQRLRASQWVLRSQPIGTETGGNEDESVTYLSEEQLRRFWVKSLGLPESTYNEQTALTKMLLSDEDDDDDDFEGSSAQYVPIGSTSITKPTSNKATTTTNAKAQPKTTSTTTMGKRLLQRRRTTSSTSSPDPTTRTSTSTSTNSSVAVSPITSIPLPVMSGTSEKTTTTSSVTGDDVSVRGSR